MSNRIIPRAELVAEICDKVEARAATDGLSPDEAREAAMMVASGLGATVLVGLVGVEMQKRAERRT